MGFAYVIHGGSDQKRVFEFEDSGFRKRLEVGSRKLKVGSQKAKESSIEIHALADIFGYHLSRLPKDKS